jgi:hypothetical protein
MAEKTGIVFRKPPAPAAVLCVLATPARRGSSSPARPQPRRPGSATPTGLTVDDDFKHEDEILASLKSPTVGVALWRPVRRLGVDDHGGDELHGLPVKISDLFFPWMAGACGRVHRRDGRIRREPSQRNLCVLCRLCGANVFHDKSLSVGGCASEEKLLWPNAAAGARATPLGYLATGKEYFFTASRGSRPATTLPTRAPRRTLGPALRLLRDACAASVETKRQSNIIRSLASRKSPGMEGNPRGYTYSNWEVNPGPIQLSNTHPDTKRRCSRATRRAGGPARRRAARLSPPERSPATSAVSNRPSEATPPPARPLRSAHCLAQ